MTQQSLDNISRDLATALADYQRAKAATTVAADAVKKSTAEIAAATAERGLAAYNLSQASVPAPTGGYIAPFTVMVLLVESIISPASVGTVAIYRSSKY